MHQTAILRMPLYVCYWDVDSWHFLGTGHDNLNNQRPLNFVYSRTAPKKNREIFSDFPALILE